MTTRKKRDADHHEARKRTPQGQAPAKIVLPSSGLAEEILAANRGTLLPEPPPAATAVPAPPPADPPGSGPGVQLVTFRTGPEEYALDIAGVLEIIHPEEIRRVPDAPPFIRGVVDHRQSVIAILDLAGRLGLPPGDLTTRSRIIILGAADGRRLGLLVDRVERVVTVPGTGIEPLPPEIDSFRGLLCGVARTEERLVALLDPDRLLEHLPDGWNAAPAEDAPGAAKPAGDDRELHLVNYRIGREEHALELASVREIVRVGQISPLPHTPAFIAGVVSLRGRIIPVIDVRRRFGLPAVQPGPDSRIIVVDFRGELLGLLVDAVVRVARIPVSAVEPPPANEAGVRFTRGIGLLNGRLIMITDTDRLLDRTEEGGERGSAHASP
jgi:purine-binding chemotaxis protein CheW